MKNQNHLSLYGIGGSSNKVNLVGTTSLFCSFLPHQRVFYETFWQERNSQSKRKS